MESIIARPYAAIVISKDDSGQGVIERYRVDKNGVLRNPAPVSRSFIESLSQMFGSEEKKGFQGRIPPRTLYMAKNTIAWWQPAGRVELLVSKERAVWWQPPTVFVYTGPEHSLQVYWSRSMNPSMAKKPCLTYARVPNNTAFSLCLGDSMKGVRSTTDPSKMINAVEHAFYKSWFTEWRSESSIEIMARMKKIADNKEGMKLLSEIPEAQWLKLENVF